ncbi:uncharacterized protein LOC134251087 [Saccostrea cucullata]|uniref:uncharacterized protein LOC134251087 n=1 Tax=Saccostrea cuccullata TaxID=36930 RepID=UPI002ED2DA57
MANTEEDSLPILREEVEAAINTIKLEKSAGIDNIPSELVKAGGEAMITALTTICNNIWSTGIWPTPWKQSLSQIITLPKKGNLQLCNNYRTISLISHLSKVMLKIILNRLKPVVETIIADEQAGFRTGRRKETELTSLVNRLDQAASSYGIEISAEKTKLMANNTQGITSKVNVSGTCLETVKSFKYLGSIISDEGSKAEIIARIAQTTAVLAKLQTIWRDRNITLRPKIQLMCSLAMSVFLYACETWTLTAELEKRIMSTEMRCYRKILGINYTDHVTNAEVDGTVTEAIGPHNDFLTIVKKRKLRWYGQVSRSSGLAKTILQGTVKGGRKRGRQKKRWEDNIPKWTGLSLAETQRATKRFMDKSIRYR